MRPLAARGSEGGGEVRDGGDIVIVDAEIVLESVKIVVGLLYRRGDSD